METVLAILTGAMVAGSIFLMLSKNLVRFIFGLVLASNAVYYAGGSNSWDCFDLQLGDSGYQTVDNNLCYYPGASGGEWESGSGALAAWQGASPFDDSSLVADPGYAAPAAGDLAPAAGSSPLVGAGHATASAPRDFHCQTRSDPDIGAFEW